MSITLVQATLCGHNSGTFNSSGGTLSCTGSFPSPTTAGNFIVAVCFTSSTGTFNALNISSSFSGATLNASGGFSNQRNSPLWKGTGIFFTVGNAPSISSSTTLTFTAHVSGISTGSATLTAEFCLFEFSGCIQSSSPIVYVDNGTSGNGTSSTPDLGTLFTTKSDLMLGAFVGASGNISAGTGYTLAQTMSAVQFAQVQYALNVAAGNPPTAWSGGTEAKWGAFAYAILPLAVTLNVTPSSLAFSNRVWGFAPAIGDGGVEDGTCYAQTLTVTASGYWSVTSSVPWLLLSKTSGTGNGTVVVNLLDTGLPRGGGPMGNRVQTGQYTGTLTFTESGVSPVTVNVQFVVGYGDSLG